MFYGRERMGDGSFLDGDLGSQNGRGHLNVNAQIAMAEVMRFATGAGSGGQRIYTLASESDKIRVDWGHTFAESCRDWIDHRKSPADQLFPDSWALSAASI
jgi:hypothetical protein